MTWRPVGPGGSMFRAVRDDGRKVEVFYEPNGTWIALVGDARVGAFRSRGAAQRAAGSAP